MDLEAIERRLAAAFVDGAGVQLLVDVRDLLAEVRRLREDLQRFHRDQTALAEALEAALPSVRFDLSLQYRGRPGGIWTDDPLYRKVATALARVGRAEVGDA